mgnify:FL=1|tara:strand:+ start:201 stop:401 length:201 start_codon:yes stop_codon:yes gene_type:complete
MMTVKETHKIGEDLFFVIQYMNSSLDEYVIVLRTTDEQVARDKVKRMWDKDISAQIKKVVYQDLLI